MTSMSSIYYLKAKFYAKSRCGAGTLIDQPKQNHQAQCNLVSIFNIEVSNLNKSVLNVTLLDPI